MMLSVCFEIIDGDEYTNIFVNPLERRASHFMQTSVKSNRINQRLFFSQEICTMVMK